MEAELQLLRLENERMKEALRDLYYEAKNLSDEDWRYQRDMIDIMKELIDCTCHIQSCETVIYNADERNCCWMCDEFFCEECLSSTGCCHDCADDIKAREEK